ncbi:MAG: type I DNA topoisomerase [Holosporales bacterium]|jgi:DNA topoisomerase-1|nr:type I DNA topoisomerase [Holosporales bacterium]
MDVSEKAGTLVIVESPAKALTIERYLGSGYTVLASYGHVRDLVNKSGSVDPENGFKMVWGPTERSQQHVDNILKAVKNSTELFLATDPDREGEAIAWHISEIIMQKLKKNSPPIRRVVFHEITKTAVLNAVNNPHNLDNQLVDAYLARRALDYLVGYSLSPVLWQKLPGSKSAGRVQSVALRLIVEREQDIEKFQSQEYWSISGEFETPRNELFEARLVVFDGKKLAKLDITNQEQADKIVTALKQLIYTVNNVEKKQISRNPHPPFTTSTLQQEASRQLRFGASKTMRVAQRLYEGIALDGELTGLITYMRTDSVNLSKEAVADMREFIHEIYGKDYLPSEARTYKTKAKNAQEAHEAIRPTSIFRRPEDMSAFLDQEHLALYTLIWKRTVASQMENAVFDQVTVEIVDSSELNAFKATGITQVFDGFLRVYQEGKDDEDEDDRRPQLPLLQQHDSTQLREVNPAQHYTQPPPRFTEASLVKQLEELGIGRPSTYAPLIQVLQTREYVSLEKRQFIPSSRGRIVTAFLTNFCLKYVEYDFTANLETELDDIADGNLSWISVMNDFWGDFYKTVTQMKEIRVTDVIDKLEENLSTYLFKNENSKICQKCGGRLGLKLSKFGAFLGCDKYPECQNKVSVFGDANRLQQRTFETIELGVDKDDGSKISLRQGPYGFYLQIDKANQNCASTSKKALKPKRIGLAADVDPESMTLDTALKYKMLPKIIGSYSGESIQINIGRYGPYIKWCNVFASIPKSLDFLELTEEDAIKLIIVKQEKANITKKKTRSRATTNKTPVKAVSRRRKA